MILTAHQTRLLRALADDGPDDGDGFSLVRLGAILEPEGFDHTQIERALSGLHRLQLVVYEPARRARLTEGGLAALHSL